MVTARLPGRVFHRGRGVPGRRLADGAVSPLGLGALNGTVTLLLGLVVYRHFPKCRFWVVGLLVGVELMLQRLDLDRVGLVDQEAPGRGRLTLDDGERNRG